MSLAKPHCRNSLQRSRTGNLAVPVLGSRGRAPGALRLLLPLCCSNSRRMVQPFSSDPPFCAADIIEQAFASVRLCESEPRMMSGMKSAGACYSFKIPAKIAASLEWQHSILVHVSKVTPPTAVSRKTYGFKNGVETGHDSRASAHFFQKLFHRAEAMRGHFPPLTSLTLRCTRLRVPRRAHQTGPP